jgi:hypothetical protein
MKQHSSKFKRRPIKAYLVIRCQAKDNELHFAKAMSLKHAANVIQFVGSLEKENQ